ncbi:MAG: dicarboxylate/amino acid:cation symporter [Planctomycetaceae bacterium]|nr:dicarboxylate/amino acid:cation symporter [Planctomycetaceae bacterium]
MSLPEPSTVEPMSEPATSNAPAKPPRPPDAPPTTGEHGSSGGWFSWWHETPLYLRILGGCVLGVLVGVLLGESAQPLAIPSQLVLRLLGALAAPLILLAVVQALMHANFPRGSGLWLVSLLVLNTLVAIFIGLAVANTVRPGKWTNAGRLAAEAKQEQKTDLLAQFLDNVPRSILGPLGDGGKVISVIILAIAFGIALRRLKDLKVATVADVVDVGFRTLLILLHWVIEVIPLAVFGIVASIVGTKGFGAFIGLGAFIIAVLIGLALQMTYYLVRIWFGSWARPLDVLRGMRDALVMAFSTASSTATMPVTYACLVEKVGLRERSASLGALVGANFNNDGTALYEAMAALFISQLIGVELTFWQQLLVVLTSVAASVGAAGIPEAGIVTMTLVFNAVGLPIEYIPILLTVDWFLDRCRTTVNVMGDVNVSCLLDGYERGPPLQHTPEDKALADLA